MDTCGRVTRNFQQRHQEDGCYTNSHGYCPCPLELAPESTADLICSDMAADSDLHMPVIDFDVPVRLVPSGTEGHSHLYIDVTCTFEHYVGILEALAKAGIVQWGYHDATVDRGYGSLRHPDRPKVR